MNNLQVEGLANAGAGEVHEAVDTVVGSVDDLGKCDSNAEDIEAIAALNRCAQLSPQKLTEMRFKGMQSVRFEFIVRLMRLKLEIYTLSIYWEDGKDFLRIPVVEKVLRKLVYASPPRVSGKFEDISLLCYACDPAVKAKVDAELDRMVAVIGKFLGEVGVSPA